MDTWVVLLLQIRIAVQVRQHCPAPLCVLLWVMKHSPLICAFFVVSASLALDVSAGVIQAMDGPFAHMQKYAANAKPHVVQKRASGKVQAAYFSNWYILCCPEGLHPRLLTY
jgi:hypothetical protein